MTMTELVTITVEDGVADVRLNRADKYNALSPEMFAAITEAGEKVATLPGVRVVVLSGKAGVSCRPRFQLHGHGDRERALGAEATVGAANSGAAGKSRPAPGHGLEALSGPGDLRPARGPLAGGSRWPWVRISALRPPTLSRRSWKSNGAWSRTWASHKPCGI